MDPVSLVLTIVGVLAAIIFGAWQIYLSRKQILLQEQQTRATDSKPKFVEITQLTETQPSVSKTVTTYGTWNEILKHILFTEIPKQLRSINVFDRKSLEQAYNRILTNLSFSKRITSVHALNNITNLNLLPSHQVGLMTENIEKLLNDKDSITIAFAPSSVGISAIFFFLKFIKHYNVHLLYKFAHSTEIVSRIRKGVLKPDVCAVSSAPAIHLINKDTRPIYDFFMLMPQTEQRIIAPKVKNFQYKEDAISEGSYCLITNELSTPLFEYEEFLQRGIINKNRVHTENKEAHEAIPILLAGDVDNRLILWTPFWQLNCMFDLGVELEKENYTSYMVDTMLFFKHPFLRLKSGKRVEALLIAIRDAWAALYDQANLEATVRIMLNNKDYTETLRRASGFYQLGIN